MRIALDYDETFTEDEILWSEFVALVKRRGHHVQFVTSRYRGEGNDDIRADAQRLGIDIVFCDGEPKSQCTSANVWIDDSPEYIVSLTGIRHLAETRLGVGA